MTRALKASLSDMHTCFIPAITAFFSQNEIILYKHLKKGLSSCFLYRSFNDIRKKLPELKSKFNKLTARDCSNYQK